MPRKPRDTTAGLFHIYTHCVWAAGALYRETSTGLSSSGISQK
jgi:hypothetical protein